MGGGQYHVHIVFYWLLKADILKFTCVAESTGRGGAWPPWIRACNHSATENTLKLINK